MIACNPDLLLSTDGVNESSLALVQLLATRLLQLNSLLPTAVYAHPAHLPLLHATSVRPSLDDRHRIITRHAMMTITRAPIDSHLILPPEVADRERARQYLQGLLRQTPENSTIPQRLQTLQQHLTSNTIIPPPTFSLATILVYLADWLARFTRH
ncbi:hypothetical protein PLESTM_001290600 [Pleodorina starrii]|nr:hypothetical protein PLESTM_001290600 [Pleodorina starrii]